MNIELLMYVLLFMLVCRGVWVVYVITVIQLSDAKPTPEYKAMKMSLLTTSAAHREPFKKVFEQAVKHRIRVTHKEYMDTLSKL